MAKNKHTCDWCGETFQEQFMFSENARWFCNNEEACASRFDKKNKSSTMNALFKKLT